jgi:hypothetical protein
MYEYRTVISLSMLWICTKRKPSLMCSETSVNDDDDDDDIITLFNMNIYVKQSNTTLKDVNTHRATCFG